MFAITGITGQVGGQVADELLAAGKPVRAVLRDKAKAWSWIERGCEAAIAAMDDAGALAAAFDGVEAAFVLLPPVFDPTPGFVESRRNIAAISAALRAARVPRVVVLSTIGADAAPENLLTQLQLLEQALADLPAAVSFLQPVERRVAMVATADVAHAAAALLQEASEGHRVVELEGPARVSPADLARALGQALGRDVVAQPVPRAEWEALFRAQGMTNPMPRMRMLDGFNEGWIDFDPASPRLRRGETSLQQVVDGLVNAGR